MEIVWGRCVPMFSNLKKGESMTRVSPDAATPEVLIGYFNADMNYGGGSLSSNVSTSDARMELVKRGRASLSAIADGLEKLDSVITDKNAESFWIWYRLLLDIAEHADLTFPDRNKPLGEQSPAAWIAFCRKHAATAT